MGDLPKESPPAEKSDGTSLLRFLLFIRVNPCYPRLKVLVRENQRFPGPRLLNLKSAGAHGWSLSPVKIGFSAALHFA